MGGTNHTLQLPKGWRAQAWARVQGARFETWTPQRRLLVSSSDGQITELTPGRGAPKAKTLINGLSDPQGMAFDTLGHTRVLYVAENNQLDRYVWHANGTVGSRSVVVGGLLGSAGSGNHPAKSIVVGKNHTIYMTGGSTSNASAGDLSAHPPRGVIYAVNPSTRRLSVYATGVRNGEGLGFAPDGSLWTAVNQRDDIAYPFHHAYAGQPDAYGKVIQAYVNDHPPDELTRLRRGANLGWPYCDPDPDVHPGVQGSPLHYAQLGFDNDVQTNPGGKAFNCAKLEKIQRGLPAHSAPLGLSFLEGSKVPAQWRNGALVSTHGSWDRQPAAAPSVLWLPWNSRTRTLGAPVRLISGFQLANGDRWGRSVDAIPGPDGNLYVTDDGSGTVYRIGP
ncbi:MAG: hypothetical protein J2O48_06070 [Solirubrobacterales bacterium]|nr:hypothetical protein [Solirubrobacterales bacterium]